METQEIFSGERSMIYLSGRGSGEANDLAGEISDNSDDSRARSYIFP